MSKYERLPEECVVEPVEITHKDGSVEIVGVKRLYYEDKMIDFFEDGVVFVDGDELTLRFSPYQVE